MEKEKTDWRICSFDDETYDDLEDGVWQSVSTEEIK